jgi:hypothetical protein
MILLDSARPLLFMSAGFNARIKIMRITNSLMIISFLVAGLALPAPAMALGLAHISFGNLSSFG